MPTLMQKAVFSVRKARTVSNLFMMGWGLRIPFVSRDAQRRLRRGVLDLRGSPAVKRLRLLRNELRGRLRKVDGSIDPDAGAKAARAVETRGIVSFDFYDTLFTRAATAPEDVFSYMGHLLQREGRDPEGEFRAVRRKADAEARIAGRRGDVTLAEIYAAFPERWGAEQRAAAMALELRLERDLLRPREAVAELARRLKARGGAPVIVSDTCMDAGFMASVLERHGLGDTFDQVFCSADVLRRKDDGTIWPWLKQRLPIAEAGFAHIGDNARSDVVQPRRAGLDAVGITDAPLTAELRGFPVPRHWRSAAHDWRAGVLLGPAIAAVGNDPFRGSGARGVDFAEAGDFGHAVIGPLVMGFIGWTLQRALADGHDRLFFLARDGYFLQRIYDACVAGAGFAAPPSSYLCVSRRSAVPAGFCASGDPGLLLKNRFKGRLGDLVEGRLGVDLSAIAGAAVAGQEIRLPQDRDRAAAALAAHAGPIRAALKPEHDHLVAYLQACGLTADRRGAIVDFSGSGTIQMALQAVLGRGIDGYYMMISRAFGAEDGLGGRSAACYVDAHQQWELQPVQASAILLEGLLTAPYGQTTGYRPGPDGIVPVCGPEPDSGARFDAIRRCMEGAERYCADLVSAYGADVLLIDMPKRDAQLPLGAFVAGKLRMPQDLRDAIAVEDAFGGNGRMAFHA